MMQDQCDNQMSTCGDMFDSADRDEAFLNCFIRGDETKSFLYDLQLKRQSAMWKSPLLTRNEKLQQVRPKSKAILELFLTHV
jgi:hypothetical protein